ncbi:MAG: hypothetical protein Q8Q09_15495 [Deltaproteobacteria bacterium]|nr:hypothetical protein [Deltaproteobacteria bacterium]
MTRRHLPVLQSKPEPKTPDQGPEAEGDDSPAWHWIPLGMGVCIGASTLLARWLWVPYSQALVARLGAHPSVAAISHAQSRLALLGAGVAITGSAVGGLVVGALGNAKTNQRHGMLAGLSAMLLLSLLINAKVTFAGLLASALMLPIGALAAYVGAVGGLQIRYRVMQRAAKQDG